MGDPGLPIITGVLAVPVAVLLFVIGLAMVGRRWAPAAGGDADTGVEAAPPTAGFAEEPDDGSFVPTYGPTYGPAYGSFPRVSYAAPERSAASAAIQGASPARMLPAPGSAAPPVHGSYAPYAPSAWQRSAEGRAKAAPEAGWAEREPHAPPARSWEPHGQPSQTPPSRPYPPVNPVVREAYGPPAGRSEPPAGPVRYEPFGARGTQGRPADRGQASRYPYGRPNSFGHDMGQSPHPYDTQGS